MYGHGMPCPYTDTPISTQDTRPSTPDTLISPVSYGHGMPCPLGSVIPANAGIQSCTPLDAGVRRHDDLDLKSGFRRGDEIRGTHPRQAITPGVITLAKKWGSHLAPP